MDNTTTVALIQAVPATFTGLAALLMAFSHWRKERREQNAEKQNA